RAQQNDPIMKAQRLQDTLSMSQHLCMFGVARLGAGDFDQLDFVELMDANHSPRADAGRARLTAKARRIGAVVDRQLTLFQNLFAVDICHRRFSRWDEVMFSQRACVQSLLHRVILVGKFWKLADANQAMRADHEWRRNLAVTMLARMQIEHELNQRPL